MSSRATDLVKQWLKQWVVKDLSSQLWTQVWQAENNIVQVNQFWNNQEQEEEKWLWDTVKDLAVWAWNMVTQPTLNKAVRPSRYTPWENTWFDWLNGDDVQYIQGLARDGNEAFSMLKEKGKVTDEKLARERIEEFFKERKDFEQKNAPVQESQPKVDLYKEALEKQKKEFLEQTKKKAYDFSANYITDFAALRTTTEQNDALEYYYNSHIDSIYDIKKKQKELASEWKSSAVIDENLAKAENASKAMMKRIGEVALMQAEIGWTAWEVESKISKRVQDMWFWNINEYINQDVVAQYWVNKNMQHLDIMKQFNAKADIDYQREKTKDWTWDWIWAQYHKIGSQASVWINKYITSWWANLVRTATSDLWGSDLAWLKSYEFDENWIWWIRKSINSFVWALPELGTFLTLEWAGLVAKTWAWAAVWTAFGWPVWTVVWAWVWLVWWLLGIWSKVSKLLKATKLWVQITDKLWDVSKAVRASWAFGELTLKWGYMTKVFQWIWLTPSNAIKAERYTQNLVNTIVSKVPYEVKTGLVGNAFDPVSWSLLQEHFAYLDIGFGFMWWALRNWIPLTAIQRRIPSWLWTGTVVKMNDVFDSPEAWEKFLKSILSSTTEVWRYNEGLKEWEARLFATAYKPLLKATEDYIWMIRSWELPISHPLRSMSEEAFTSEVKKSYASSWLRDLYIKWDWQVTDADRLLLGNMQKLVKDPTINVADMVKLTYNIPGKVELVGFDSKIKLKADVFLSQLDFNYGKEVDSIFTLEWWKPDSVMSSLDLDKVYKNVQDVKLYNELFIEWWANPKYFDKVEWGFKLTQDWLEYLWIIDRRSSVETIIKSDNAISVTDAIRKSWERTWDVIAEDTLQLLEKNNTIDKLISFFWC